MNPKNQKIQFVPMNQRQVTHGKPHKYVTCFLFKKSNKCTSQYTSCSHGSKARLLMESLINILHAFFSKYQIIHCKV